MLDIATQFYAGSPPPDMIMESTNPLPVLVDELEKALINYPLKYRKRAMFVFTELMQNIQKHQTGNDGLVLIWKNKKEIIFSGINNISMHNLKAVEKEVKSAKALTDKELKSEIKSRWQHTNKPGTGLLQIIRKSNCFPVINYKTKKNKLFISIKIHIHVH
ncbi:MAG: DUF6272 family protein [Bacteroidota bacterium]|nr:DUF6272 family protein [Bacteroidota bacterium]